MRDRDGREDEPEAGCWCCCWSLRADGRTGDDSRDAFGEGASDVGAEATGAVWERRGLAKREGVDCDCGGFEESSVTEDDGSEVLAALVSAKAAAPEAPGPLAAFGLSDAIRHADVSELLGAGIVVS